MTLTHYGLQPTRTLWDDMLDLQDGLNRFFDLRRAAPYAAYPPVNIWHSENELVIDAELPGVDPEKVDISLEDQQLTIRGTRPADEMKSGEAYLRRERQDGAFVRTVTLPYRGEPDRVKATYRNGILRITVPRAEADKPRKIAIQAA